MMKVPSFGELGVDVTMETSPAVVTEEVPFRILVMGDFSGRGLRGAAGYDLPRLKPIEIDRDCFDLVMSQLGVQLDLATAPAVSLSFRELDDFHPDRILERVEVFDRLRQTRRRLLDASTFADAAAEVRAWAGLEAADAAERQPPAPEDMARPSIPADDLLGQILDQAASPTSPPAETWDRDLRQLLHEAVKPHLVPNEDPQRPQLIACVDQALTQLMRELVHSPGFQALESAWRALYFLVSRLETGVKLKLYLLDLSKAELATDLESSEDLAGSAIFELLVERAVLTPGAEPWSLLAANYTFDQTPEDIQTLGRMAKVACAAGAPFIAAASPHVLGCESLVESPDPRDWRGEDEAWEALRRLPEIPYLGLALPRFLLRLPYGADTDPVEQFAFEETADPIRHEEYLWANPAFACALLLGQAFSEYGWDFRPGIFLTIDGLPMHVYPEDGEPQIKPCAEVLMTERAAGAILDRGLMPLLSFKGRDTIRLARFQSLADPPARLRGRWD